MLLALDFKPPIHPPLVGVLDPRSGTRAKYSINCGFNHFGVETHRVKSLKNANDIWKKLMEIHEGTSSVKEAKLYLLKDNLVNLL